MIGIDNDLKAHLHKKGETTAIECIDCGFESYAEEDFVFDSISDKPRCEDCMATDPRADEKPWRD